LAIAVGSIPSTQLFKFKEGEIETRGPAVVFGMVGDSYHPVLHSFIAIGAGGLRVHMAELLLEVMWGADL
jgi:hypothetical protein